MVSCCLSSIVLRFIAIFRLKNYEFKWQQREDMPLALKILESGAQFVFDKLIWLLIIYLVWYCCCSPRTRTFEAFKAAAPNHKQMPCTSNPNHPTNPIDEVEHDVNPIDEVEHDAKPIDEVEQDVSNTEYSLLDRVLDLSLEDSIVLMVAFGIGVILALCTVVIAKSCCKKSKKKKNGNEYRDVEDQMTYQTLPNNQ